MKLQKKRGRFAVAAVALLVLSVAPAASASTGEDCVVVAGIRHCL